MPAPHVNAPLIGEHAVELLKELGYNDEQIKDMADKKATIIR